MAEPATVRLGTAGARTGARNEHKWPGTDPPVAPLTASDAPWHADCFGREAVPGHVCLGWVTQVTMDQTARHKEQQRAASSPPLRPIEATDRLAMIGQVASGLAHELNTPLACVAAHAEEAIELLERAVLHHVPEELATELRMHLLAIVRHSGRCARILHQLLQFARPSGRLSGHAALPQVVTDVVELLRPLADSKAVGLQLDVPRHLPPLAIAPADLEQLLANLIHNAIDACGHGGLVTISASQQDDMVQVIVADNGCGIPEENLARVFEPFFTTKPEGKGSGLGLSVCHGIVRAVAGDIRIESTEGAGTKVFVKLPVSFTADVVKRAADQ